MNGLYTLHLVKNTTSGLSLLTWDSCEFEGLIPLFFSIIDLEYENQSVFTPNFSAILKSFWAPLLSFNL